MNDSMFKGLFGVLAGLFAMFCAYKDFDWFMENHKARFFVNIFGRDGARVFYGILGLLLVLLGVMIGIQ